MKKFYLIASFLIGLSGVALSHSPAQAAAPDSFADLAEKLLPAVVNISTTQKTPAANNFPEMQDGPAIPGLPPGSPFEDFFEQFMDRRGGRTAMPATSLGSGFIIDAEQGYAITNAHVIENADDITITFHDDSSAKAEVIGRDEKTDIAVLKIKNNDKIPQKLAAVSFGDSDILRVGDWVVAIGNPFGLGGTVTAGIISARQRDIHSGPYDDYLQTDASINRGNSGGPMFNLAGEVIGINTAIYSPTGGSVGIGFAIPVSLAKPVIDQIIEYGRTRRGWLGVRIQSVTDEIAESLGLDSPKGALVASITKDGPAEEAGLKVGDIILGFNGHDVPQMRDLPRIVAETDINSTVKVEYWRNGKKRTAKVKVGELEKAEESGVLDAHLWDSPTPPDSQEPEGRAIEMLGLRVAPITPKYREIFGLDNDIEGIIIIAINDDSDALQKGLLEGDVIVEVNQTPVKDAKDIEKVIKSAQKDKRNSVLLLVERGGEVRFVALKIQSDEQE